MTMFTMTKMINVDIETSEIEQSEANEMGVCFENNVYLIKRNTGNISTGKRI